MVCAGRVCEIIGFSGRGAKVCSGGMTRDSDATNKCNISYFTKDIEEQYMVLEPCY